MKDKELVSIIIPTYNRNLNYIKRAINSIFHQTYRYYEIIVVDDNDLNSKYSPCLKKFCIMHNIIYIKTNGNEGANKARNLGACYSKGVYLAFLDDDDFWLKDKLKLQLELFSENIGMTYSNGFIAFKNSKKLYFHSQKFICDGDLYKLYLFNYIGPTISALIKKECFFEIGMFDEEMPAKQDYDLWIRIMQKYKVKGISRPLYVYTRHTSYQISKDYKLILKGYKLLYRKNILYFKNEPVLKYFYNIKLLYLYKKNKKYLSYIKLILNLIINGENLQQNILY